MKVCLDYGHGGKDPGAVLGDRKESQDVLRLGQQVAAVLRSRGIEVGETRDRDIFVSLEQRIIFANRGGYDYFISLHRNSCSPIGPKGVEVFTAKQCSPKAVALAKKLQQGLVRVGFQDRGVKVVNFYVLAKTHMPAVLIELGFINQPIDNFIFDSQAKELVGALVGAIL